MNKITWVDMLKANEKTARENYITEDKDYYDIPQEEQEEQD